MYLNYTQLTLLLWFVQQQEETDDLFQSMYIPHTHTVWAKAHATASFLCGFASFFSLACTTLLVFLACAVQLGEFWSH